MTHNGIRFEQVRVRELSDEETASYHAFSLVMDDEAHPEDRQRARQGPVGGAHGCLLEPRAPRDGLPGQHGGPRRASGEGPRQVDESGDAGTDSRGAARRQRRPDQQRGLQRRHLGINRLLGFESYIARTAWQADLAAVGAYLARG